MYMVNGQIKVDQKIYAQSILRILKICLEVLSIDHG